MSPEEEEAAIKFLEERSGKRRELTKVCTWCKSRRSTSDFYFYKKTGRRKSECIECSKSNQKNYNKKASPRTLIAARIKHYMKTYGMELSEAVELTTNRTGLCEICRQIRKLTVDHNHETGSIRGKVCQPCNMVLGMAYDNSEILFSAIEYLERYKELLTQPSEKDIILDKDQT